MRLALMKLELTSDWRCHRAKPPDNINWGLLKNPKRVSNECSKTKIAVTLEAIG
jgi:hypothetical protein